MIDGMDDPKQKLIHNELVLLGFQHDIPPTLCGSCTQLNEPAHKEHDSQGKCCQLALEVLVFGHINGRFVMNFLCSF
jgi:hypothetical protein